MESFTNRDLKRIVTPIIVNRLEELLIESDYPSDETNFLVDGFTEGFDICYEGPTCKQNKYLSQ